MDAELLRQYKNTNYWFVVNDRTITLSVGSTNCDFNSLCRDISCKAGAFNPHSNLLPIRENRRRNRLLEAELENLGGVHYFFGVGEDRYNQWPAEESFMIFGAQQQTVIDLARQYQQNAFLWIPYHQPAVLITV